MINYATHILGRLDTLLTTYQLQFRHSEKAKTAVGFPHQDFLASIRNIPLLAPPLIEHYLIVCPVIQKRNFSLTTSNSTSIFYYICTADEDKLVLERRIR